MSGRFRYDPKDEMKMQMKSDATQSCRLYFGELGTGGRAGTQRVEDGGGKRRERGRKKGVKSDNPSRRGEECRGDRLPPPWIQRCPAMSSQLSLYAGVEVPVRTGSERKAVRKASRRKKAARRKRLLRGACAVLF